MGSDSIDAVKVKWGSIKILPAHPFSSRILSRHHSPLQAEKRPIYFSERDRSPVAINGIAPIDPSKFYAASGIICSSLSLIALRASRSSYSSCNPIQNCTEVPNTLARRKAVSAVMPRLPSTISLMRRGGTPMELASLVWLIAIGSRNSSRRISPG